MLPKRWGVESPINTELSRGLDQEIKQDHRDDDLAEQANRAQRRRFQRIETLKAIGLLVGGLILCGIALLVIGMFVK